MLGNRKQKNVKVWDCISYIKENESLLFSPSLYA